MNPFSSLCDDMYINMTLNTEMDLSSSRDTVLHHFEQIQKKYPGMQNFYCRERSEFVLEEQKDQGQYRWTSVEPRRLCSGAVNPNSVEDAMEQHSLVLELAAYGLSISPLDCEALDLLFGFDFSYRGNHNQVVYEALGVTPSLDKVMDMPEARMVNYEPTITIALDEGCRRQLRLSVETRTNAYQIRTGEFPEDQLSVYVTARQYGSLDAGGNFVTTVNELSRACEEVLEQHVIENVLHPLQRTIALK